MTHVIFLNGPPRCGKDTAGEIITRAVVGARAIKMAHALKIGTHALFAGLRGDGAAASAMARGPNSADLFELSKNTPNPFFFGLSPREAYIAVSERLCKPLFGDKFFGELVAAQIVAKPGVPVWAVTDSGFAEESETVIAAVGRENCTLIRLYRTGCSFARDSRRYIDLDVARVVDLWNDHSLEQFEHAIRGALGNLDASTRGRGSVEP